MTLEQVTILQQHRHEALAFTGHRPNKVAGFELHIRVHILASLMFMEPIEVISGMAVGVDTWAAESALTLGIPLVAAVPFKGQEARWPSAARRLYQSILARATRVHTICEGAYHPSKMQARNEWIVERCGLLLAYWNGSTGGTANCVGYARRIKRDLLVVDPTTIRSNLTSDPVAARIST